VEINHDTNITAYKFSDAELNQLREIVSMPLVKAYFSTLRNHILRLRFGVDLIQANAKEQVVVEDAYCKGQNDLLLRLNADNITNVS